MSDLPHAFGDPVDTLLGFHRRVERQLACLASLACRLELDGIDASSIAAAASLLDFFSRALEVHHADEEDVMRAVDARARRSDDRDRLAELHRRVEAEHREMDRTWRALRRPLQGIAEGASRNVPGDLVRYFRASHATHISIEESGLHLAAARLLGSGERGSLARGMAARRTRSYRFQ